MSGLLAISWSDLRTRLPPFPICGSVQRSCLHSAASPGSAVVPGLVRWLSLWVTLSQWESVVWRSRSRPPRFSSSLLYLVYCHKSSHPPEKSSSIRTSFIFVSFPSPPSFQPSVAKHRCLSRSKKVRFLTDVSRVQLHKLWIFERYICMDWLKLQWLRGRGIYKQIWITIVHSSRWNINRVILELSFKQVLVSNLESKGTFIRCINCTLSTLCCGWDFIQSSSDKLEELGAFNFRVEEVTRAAA